MKKKVKKTKECPDCGLKVGSKVRKCVDCDHEFTFIKKIINPKKCYQCNTDNKKRAKECISCGFVFPIKGAKKTQYEEIKNWKKLRPGSIFHLTKESGGPYFITSEDILKDKIMLPAGSRIEMNERGQFSVYEICKDGICVMDNGLKYIYMGPPKYCEKTGIYREPYKLFKKL